MDKSLQFVVEFPIENIDIGQMGDLSLNDISKKIRQTIKDLDESKDLRDEYAKCFCDELGERVELYINAMLAITKGMKNVRIKGMNHMNYKKLLEDRMPVTFDSVGIEEGAEVEYMWLADFSDGKWVEDYLTVRRTQYDIETDEAGAVFAKIENGRMLVKAPHVKYYRIPENVYRIADHAFKDCVELEELDVPYLVDDYQIGKALKLCGRQFKVHLWNWSYDGTRSKELEKEIAEGWTDEMGFVYSQDRKRLLKAPSKFKKYWIPEGVEKIDRLAFDHCVFEDLHIPYTCKMEDWPKTEWPVWGNERIQGIIWPWEKPYSKVDEIEDSDFITEESTYTDDFGVVYSSNKKRLLWSTSEFDQEEYSIPDGVETICSYSFAACKHFITLSVPSSIKVIGGNLFGQKGGKIGIR